MLLKRKPHTELEFLVQGSGFTVRSLESVFPSTVNREPGTLNHAAIFVVLLLGAMASAASAHDPSVRAVRVAGRLSEQALLSLAQKQTFRYFWDGAEPTSGMALERIHVGRESSRHRGQVVATGGSGFGLMALLVGIERGFVSRKAALERLSKIVAFLEQADRFPGTWPHWLNGETGKVIREAAGMSSQAFGPVLTKLVKDGTVESTNVIKNQRTYEGFKLTSGTTGTAPGHHRDCPAQGTEGDRGLL